MPEAYLHIGHGKTGSSYLQSVLALSEKSLAKEGFYYPLQKDVVSDPERISSGNGYLLTKGECFEREAIFKDNIIFSDEHFFRFFCNDFTVLENVKKQLLRLGFSKINILLYIRNPVSHASSSYQQSVKRDGLCERIDTVFEKYTVPEKVLNLINYVEKDSFFKLTIFNYSLVKNDLIGCFCSWLGFDRNKLSMPKKAIINRSLTKSELELQRQFNGHLGKCAGLISDPLCENLSDIKSDTILPSLEVQSRMLKRLEKAIEGVNKYCGVQGYEYDVSEEDIGSEKETYEFTKEQIEIICKSLSSRIIEQKRRMQKRKLMQ